MSARVTPEYYRDVAERLAREMPGSFFVNQFGNPANPQAHEETTAPEIWEQMHHRLDAVVCGVGTGGTLTGISRFFARTAAPWTWCWQIPPAPLADYVKTGKARRRAAGGWWRGSAGIPSRQSLISRASAAPTAFLMRRRFDLP
jgi:cystathionine beta-synthase